MKARDNPFRVDCVLRVRYELRGTTWPELLARCQSLAYRVALVGPHGTGKTTLLEDLAPRFREAGFQIQFLRLDDERRAFPPGLVENLSAALTPRDFLLFDGAEQMSLVVWQWFKWLTRKAGGLIITTHRAGRLPTLWECKTSADLLGRIGARLLEVEPGEVRELAASLFHKHSGNLRDALREWYDLMAEEPRHGIFEIGTKWDGDLVTAPGAV